MTSGKRGLVVMLVDNGVVGDSRVQKQAQSMADVGWDVRLLGLSRTNAKREQWTIGDAQVTLLPFPAEMSQRRHEFRRAPLRSPLAYRPGRFASYRRAQVLARRSMLQAKVAAQGDPGSSQIRRTWARIGLRANAVERRWVDARASRTRTLRAKRRDLSGWVDRASTQFWVTAYGPSAWRKLDPELSEFEAVLAEVVDRLKPDIIHANDFRMLGVGARAKMRAAGAGRSVKLVWDAHEFLPGIRPWHANPRWMKAQILHERQFVPYADEVLTVTEPLAQLLVAEHGLARAPTVVMNTPWVDVETTDEVTDIRTACGLDARTPLLVYSGAAAPQRGLATMVEGLVDLTDTHVALVVAAPRGRYAKSLAAQATALGVADRLHLLPYVPVKAIVPFLRTATIGVMPAHKWLNHEISLATKFFEYAHAGLPIVVSNLKAMADMVEATGQGEVFTAEDTADYVAAVERVLADVDRYRRAYDDVELMNGWTWASQAVVLDEVYARVLGHDA